MIYSSIREEYCTLFGNYCNSKMYKVEGLLTSNFLCGGGVDLLWNDPLSEIHTVYRVVGSCDIEKNRYIYMGKNIDNIDYIELCK